MCLVFYIVNHCTPCVSFSSFPTFTEDGDFTQNVIYFVWLNLRITIFYFIYTYLIYLFTYLFICFSWWMFANIEKKIQSIKSRQRYYAFPTVFVSSHARVSWDMESVSVTTPFSISPHIPFKIASPQCQSEYLKIMSYFLLFDPHCPVFSNKSLNFAFSCLTTGGLPEKKNM